MGARQAACVAGGGLELFTTDIWQMGCREPVRVHGLIGKLSQGQAWKPEACLGYPEIPQVPRVLLASPSCPCLCSRWFLIIRSTPVMTQAVAGGQVRGGQDLIHTVAPGAGDCSCITGAEIDEYGR